MPYDKDCTWTALLLLYRSSMTVFVFNLPLISSILMIAHMRYCGFSNIIAYKQTKRDR